MSRSRGVTIVALCTLLASGVARPAFAGPTPEQIDEGRGHFNRGVEFYKENDFRAALVEFKRAYDIAPNYKVLYNLGYTSLELQDYASALRYLERYLADGGADVAADRKTKVAQEIEKLQKRVARLTIDVNVDGAEILVDDIVVGKTPLSEPVLVSAGRRRITVSKGGANQARVIDVAGGDVQKLSFELATAPPPPPPPSGDGPPPVVVTPAETKSNPLPAGVWVGIAVTGALGVATVVTGVLALSAKGKFDDTIARAGVTTTEVDDARTKTRTFALVTDILGGATIVSAAITLIGALAHGGKAAPEQRSTGALRVQVSPFGASLTGSF